MATSFAMEIGPLQLQRPQHALKRLLAPARITGHLTALAKWLDPCGVGVIGIDSLLDGTTGKMERLATNCAFQTFQIQIAKALTAEQRFDVPYNLSREQAAECGFF